MAAGGQMEKDVNPKTLEQRPHLTSMPESWQ